MGRRNPIHVIGDPLRKGVTWLSDELIRVGAHEDALGSDGFVVIAFMLSWASAPDSNRRAWETSAAQLSEEFGWGLNRERASRALDRAVKDNRLIIRGFTRDGQIVGHRCAYVVCAGGRRFTDEELSRWSRPIALPSKASLPIGPKC
jgi:hypothetical protein